MARAIVIVATTASCASRGPVLVQATPSRTSEPAAAPRPDATSRDTWRITAREHVDLWLHAFAMLQEDSSLVPSFSRDYIHRIRALRQARRVMTSLDINATPLAAGLREHPALISAQFVPLYFESWETLRAAYDAFDRAVGDPRRAEDRDAARDVAIFAASFPAVAERDWARRFVRAVEDERTQFHRDFRLGESRAHDLGRSAFELAWRDRYAAHFVPFLRHAGYRTGEIVLTLPLGGEGRTLTPTATRALFALPSAATADSVPVVVSVLAHEVAGLVTNGVVRDHTSAAEQRDGTADRYATVAAVRGGALLLARLDPDVVETYQRYYLGLAGVRVTGAVDEVFGRTYPLPAALLTAIGRQFDMIQAGI